jgi:integrase
MPEEKVAKKHPPPQKTDTAGIYYIPRTTARKWAKPWQATWYDSTSTRRTKSFRTKRDAVAHKRQAEVKKYEGNDTAPTTATFGEYAEDWLQRQRERTYPRPLKPSSIRAWGSRLENHLIPEFGHVAMIKIKKRDIADFRNKKTPATGAKGLSPASVEGLMALIHLIFADAVEREALDRNPCPKVTKTKPPPSGPPFATEAETERFAEKVVELYPAGTWVAPFILLALYSGLRAGEILGLQWGDLELTGEEPKVTVRHGWDPKEGSIEPKSQAARRSVPLFPFIMKPLTTWKLKSDASQPEDRAFPFSIEAYRDHLAKILRAMNEGDRPPVDEGITIHRLRVQFITLSAARDVPPKKLMEWSGHSETNMTLNYYAKNMDNDQEILRKHMAGIGGVV